SQLIREGRVRRSYLGVSGQTVNLARHIALRYQLEGKTGVLVGDVHRGTSAARAGVRAGDIIVMLGPERIRTSDDLQLALGKHGIGEPVTITVLRGGERLELEARPTELPDPQQPRQRGLTFPPGA